MKDNTYLNTARTYLSEGEISDCINLLKGNIKENDILNQVLQIEIRVNNLKRKINTGTIDINDSQLEENRISNSLLMIISNLATGNTIQANNPNQKKQFDFKWLIIGILGLAVIGLAAYTFLGSNETTPSPSNLCANVTCLNGGECEEGKCNCPEGYKGERCENKIAQHSERNPCDNINCENNGQCINGQCKCPDGYTGKYCQTKVNNTPAPTPTPTTPQPIAKPDLKITAFQMKPESPQKGEKISMQAIVKNIGTGNSENFKIKWFAGENFSTPAFQKSFSGLNAGEEQVFSFQYDGYPSWYGTISSKLVIDEENSVEESDENNNVLKKSYAVAKANSTNEIAKPDLKITAFQMKPEAPKKGEKISMQAIVKNVGTGNSGNFKIKWFAGENFPTPAFQKSFSGLKAGKQEVFSFNYEGYPSWYGTISSKLVIDEENSVKESNENNNVLKKTYSVKRN